MLGSYVLFPETWFDNWFFFLIFSLARVHLQVNEAWWVIFLKIRSRTIDLQVSKLLVLGTILKKLPNRLH